MTLDAASPAQVGAANEALPDGPPPPARRKASLGDRVVPMVTSLASVAIFFGLIAYVVTSADEWPRIKRQFFSLDAMIEAFPAVLRGFWINIQVWLIALVAIAIWAMVLALDVFGMGGSRGDASSGPGPLAKS